MSTDTDLHLNTGAMALDSLPRDEAVEFIDHLSTCSTCSTELAGFLETTALLGAAVAQAPPADLRRAVLAAIKVTPQLPPITGSAPDVPPLGRHRQRDGVADVVPLRRPWYRRPQAFLAAAVALLVIGGGTAIIVANSGTSNNPPAASCAATASDRQTIAPKVGPGGDVIYSPTCAEATVTAAGLPALPSDQVYQLWALKDLNTATARSIGVMKTNANGTLDAAQALLQSGETDVAISVESAPGPAKSPSKNIVWVAHL